MDSEADRRRSGCWLVLLSLLCAAAKHTRNWSGIRNALVVCEKHLPGAFVNITCESGRDDKDKKGVECMVGRCVRFLRMYGRLVCMFEWVVGNK